MTVVVIGKSSFLARAFQKMATEFHYISHDDVLQNSNTLKQASVIINFALPPSFKTAGYTRQDDIDSRVANIVEGSATHYIMLSSRMVYGAFHDLRKINEAVAPAPANAYGEAKFRIEKSLADILNPERLTILRLSNIFGFERGRNSFFGKSLSSLADDNKIFFDMSGDTKRDFLSVETFCNYLKVIASNPKGGVYNLGSGIATPCQDVASGLIKGFRSGELIITKNELRDQFYLDMTETAGTYDLKLTTSDKIYSDFVAIGHELQNYISK